MLQRPLEAIFAVFDRITAAARQGALLREGLNVVIAGYPNAGKSSLLNRLAGDEIAIVTDLPGTTRDLLRQSSANRRPHREPGRHRGLASTGDVIEAEGVRRARGEMSKADLVLYLVDVSTVRRRTHAALLQRATYARFAATGVPVTVVPSTKSIWRISPARMSRHALLTPARNLILERQDRRGLRSAARAISSGSLDTKGRTVAR
jgi:tRNA modification GTPase